MAIENKFAEENENIVTTPRGTYKLVNRMPCGLGEMFCIKEINDEGNLSEDYRMIQIYRENGKIEMMFFNDSGWLKPYLKKFLIKSLCKKK